MTRQSERAIEKIFSKYSELVGPTKKFLAAAQKKYSATDFERIKTAIEMMLIITVDQGPRPSGDLFANHVVAVSQRVLDHTPVVDADVVVAAVLHDIVEDHPAKLAAMNDDQSMVDGTDEEKGFAVLRQKYGHRVERIVRAVTNPDFMTRLAVRGINPGHPEYRKENNILYADHVIEAIKDHDALAVKIADLRENASSLNAIQYQSENYIELRKSLAAKYLPVVEHAVELLHSLNRYPEYKEEFKKTVDCLKVILEKKSDPEN